jgi:hypothetical protein
VKGWIDTGSDVNWSDYGGKWARRAPDGSYYVIDFTNMYDACGEEECRRDGQAQYVCEVKRVDLVGGIDGTTLARALECVGWRIVLGEGIVSDQGDLVAPKQTPQCELACVEACVSYGCAAPLESFSGNKRASWIRAEARRYAETCMRDDALLEERLQRPVNAIGSTAAEYGRGDLDSALNRGPFDTSKNIIRKLHGLPPVEENGNG